MRSCNPNFASRFSLCIHRLSLIFACLIVGLSTAAPHAYAQATSDAPQEEIVANLAAGRVVIAVLKDAILVGTIENPIEAQTHPPVPVPLASRRVGIILGSVHWFSPSTQLDIARLDKELPHLKRQSAAEAPRLQPSQTGGEATDIEMIGEGLLDRLNEVVRGLHANIHLPPSEPLVQLIVADYIPNYGPEIWQLTYTLEQAPEHGDYWDSRVSRPRYLQIWPPEKGQPHTLVEFHYPPEDKSPSLMDLLRANDPRLEKIRASDAKMKTVADLFVAGESGKVLAADGIQFLRAAFNVIASPKDRETMAVIAEESGFAWILPPPAEQKKLGQEKEREPGAPSLLNPPSPH
jgi:hypothetical protein